jgi:hypothetical protein
MRGGFDHRRRIMTHFAGLDVSQKMTAICVIDPAGTGSDGAFVFQHPSRTAARKRVDREFSIDKCVKAHLKLYEDLIENSKWRGWPRDGGSASL